MSTKTAIASDYGSFYNIGTETFYDGSVLLTQSGTGIAVSSKETRKLARALSPVYVVKSVTGNYVGFHIYNPTDGYSNYTQLCFDWQESQKDAARFTSKIEAQKIAKVYPGANARVVRLK